MCVFSSWSTAVVESAPEEESQRLDEGNPRVPSPLVHGRISSDESEAEGNDERADFPSSAAHPRPVAVRGPYWGSAAAEPNHISDHVRLRTLNSDRKASMAPLLYHVIIYAFSPSNRVQCIRHSTA